MGHSHFRRQQVDLLKLVAEAQIAATDDTPAMNEIVRRFEPLAVRLSKKYTGKYDLQQDLANSARFALTRAVRCHDLTVAGFASYAKRFMSGAVLRTWKRLRNLGTADYDVVAVDFADPQIEPLIPAIGPAEPQDAWGGGELERIVAQLKPEQRVLLHERYVLDAELRVIAESVGTSVSAVAQRLRTAHRVISRAVAA